MFFCIITGENYGCEINSTTGTEECGFGKGEIQTEYFACADIAIFSQEQVIEIENLANTAADATDISYTVYTNSSSSNSLKKSRRSKRTVRINSPGSGVVYLPFPKNIDIQFHPVTGASFVEAVPWDRPSSRIRRRVPAAEQTQMQGRPLHRTGRQVRLNFNLRRNQGFFPQMEEIQPSPEPSMVRQEEPQVSAVPTRPPHPLNKFMQQMQPQNMQNMQNMQMPRQFGRQLQRNFIDPFNPIFTGGEMPVTQTVFSRPNVATRQCQYCPFDQCLDEHLRIDRIFPGLFDEPRTFLECRKYEKLFTVGQYDVVQEGLPECTHPRFKRQLMGMQNEDIGCCAT